MKTIFKMLTFVIFYPKLHINTPRFYIKNILLFNFVILVFVFIFYLVKFSLMYIYKRQLDHSIGKTVGGNKPFQFSSKN